MNITPTDIDGCVIVETEPIGDDRGWFSRIFCADELDAVGVHADIAQVNHVFTAHAGTLRGVHWQVGDAAETKYVRCVRGAAFDVCVDLRVGSPTHLQWFGTTISAENRRGLVVPAGCGHAYLTQADETELIYSTSAPYTPEAECGARFDDPAFGIEWPQPPTTLSSKDLNWPRVNVTR